MMCSQCVHLQMGKPKAMEMRQAVRGKLALIWSLSFLSWSLLPLIFCLFTLANFLLFLNMPSLLSSALPPMAPGLCGPKAYTTVGPLGKLHFLILLPIFDSSLKA